MEAQGGWKCSADVVLVLSDSVEFRNEKYGRFSSHPFFAYVVTSISNLSHTKNRTSSDMPESPCANPFPRERKWPAKIRQRHDDEPDIAP